MRVDVPGVRLESIRHFAREYLMIVLSILTALGLQAWIEHADHRDAARTASVKIEAEMRANLVAIDRAREHDLGRAQALEQVRDALLRDIEAGRPDAAIYRHAHQLMPDGLYLDVRRPSFRHEAWDVAVANQAASWIDDDRLRGYAAAYAVQDWGVATIAQSTVLILDGPRMNDAMLDFRHDSLPPRELLHVVNQMANVLRDTAQILQNVRQGLAKAVRADGKDAHEAR